jgi:hypothetical protein
MDNNEELVVGINFAKHKTLFLIIHLSIIILLTEYCYGQFIDWVQFGQREFDTKEKTETFFTINCRISLQPN